MAAVGGAPRPARGSRAERRRRLRSYWRDAQWWVIGALGVTALVLGFVGFHRYHTDTGGSTDFWDLAYDDIRLFFFGAGALEVPSAINTPLQIARFLAPAVASVALLRAFAPLFRDQLQLLRFRLARRHVVVCGLGRKGFQVATSLRDRGQRVVAIERAETNDRIAACRSAGVSVLVGDATDVRTLRKAGVHHAGSVMALCSDEGVNAEIAVATHELVADRSRHLNCTVQVTDPRLCSLLRARYLAALGSTAFRLDFFNTYERGAQALLLRHPAFPDDDQPGTEPHVLVVGLGRLGSSLIVQAARNWDAGDHPPDRKLRISAVDRHADEKVPALLARHPELANMCVLTPVTVDVQSPEFERCALFGPDPGTGGTPITAAYVCFDSDARSMETALVLHNRLRGTGVPIVMRAVTASGLPALLGEGREPEFGNLHAFALLDRTCDPDLVLGGTDEVIARALHDIYVEERASHGWRYGPVHDDANRTTPSMASWRELDESYRDANRDQAAHLAAKLRAVECELDELTEWHQEPFSFTDEEVELLAQMEHERWDIHQRGHGWTLGDYDLDQKQSPYLVPWWELPEDVKDYDRLFVRNLPAILAKLGYLIVRTPGRGHAAR